MRTSIGAALALTLAAAPAAAQPAARSPPVILAPRPRPGFLPIPTSLPPPSDLTSTADPAVCAQHAGPDGAPVCKAALAEGRLVFVWNWPGTIPILGYRLYRVTPPARDTGLPPAAWSRTLIGTQAHGAPVTAFLEGPAAASTPKGACFAATAFIAYRESGVSTPYCLGADARVRLETTFKF
jgi:hypothetical protein